MIWLKRWFFFCRVVPVSKFLTGKNYDRAQKGVLCCYTLDSISFVDWRKHNSHIYSAPKNLLFTASMFLIEFSYQIEKYYPIVTNVDRTCPKQFIQPFLYKQSLQNFVFSRDI